MKELYSKIVKSSLALARGQVWCRGCGNTYRVGSEECLQRGWPMCCGYTMTIDPPSPEEKESR